ncbi:MAG: hypothetical protein ACODAD_08865 [Planctomycetota bacterium]
MLKVVQDVEFLVQRCDEHIYSQIIRVRLIVEMEGFANVALVGIRKQQAMLSLSALQCRRSCCCLRKFHETLAFQLEMPQHQIVRFTAWLCHGSGDGQQIARTYCPP